jgi:hypothetical protein
VIPYRRTVEVFDSRGELEFVGVYIGISSTETHLYVTIERECPDNPDYHELAEVRYECCRFPRLHS